MERSGKLFYYGRLSATTLHQSKFWRSSKPKLFSSGFITHHIWLLCTSLTHLLSLSQFCSMPSWDKKGAQSWWEVTRDQRAASPCLFQAVSPRVLLLLSLPPTTLFSPWCTVNIDQKAFSIPMPNSLSHLPFPILFLLPHIGRHTHMGPHSHTLPFCFKGIEYSSERKGNIQTSLATHMCPKSKSDLVQGVVSIY